MFRGFAVADEVAPFVVVNDNDFPPAWSFTLLHELVHLLLGQTGISGAHAGTRVEQFCKAARILGVKPACRQDAALRKGAVAGIDADRDYYPLERFPEFRDWLVDRRAKTRSAPRRPAA